MASPIGRFDLPGQSLAILEADYTSSSLSVLKIAQTLLKVLATRLPRPAPAWPLAATGLAPADIRHARGTTYCAPSRPSLPCSTPPRSGQRITAPALKRLHTRTDLSRNLFLSCAFRRQQSCLRSVLQRLSVTRQLVLSSLPQLLDFIRATTIVTRGERRTQQDRRQSAFKCFKIIPIAANICSWLTLAGRHARANHGNSMQFESTAGMSREPCFLSVSVVVYRPDPALLNRTLETLSTALQRLHATSPTKAPLYLIDNGTRRRSNSRVGTRAWCAVRDGVDARSRKCRLRQRPQSGHRAHQRAATTSS